VKIQGVVLVVMQRSVARRQNPEDLYLGNNQFLIFTSFLTL
jgi:hypothetical protein